MIQSLLMFLVPGQESPVGLASVEAMATRLPTTPPRGILRKLKSLFQGGIAVALNAAGFLVFMAGLLLVLRLAEVLLA